MPFELQEILIFMIELQVKSIDNNSIVTEITRQSGLYYPTSNRMTQFQYVSWKYIDCPQKSYLATAYTKNLEIFRFIATTYPSYQFTKIQDFLCLNFSKSFLAPFVIKSFQNFEQRIGHVSNKKSDPLYSRMASYHKQEYQVRLLNINNLNSFVEWLDKDRVSGELLFFAKDEHWLKWQLKCPEGKTVVLRYEKYLLVFRRLVFKKIPLTVFLGFCRDEILVPRKHTVRSLLSPIFTLVRKDGLCNLGVKVPEFLLPHSTNFFSNERGASSLDFGDLDYF